MFITWKNMDMLMTICIFWQLSTRKLPESFHLRRNFCFNL